jgi:PIN domain nuclease of toxin-antitoxin system
LNLLLDTHIWIWSKLEPKRPARRPVWEALALMQKGRIHVENPFAWVERAAEELREAPLSQEIVRVGMALPLSQADPTDRFLVATAKVLRSTLLTAEQRLLGLSETTTLANR